MRDWYENYYRSHAARFNKLRLDQDEDAQKTLALVQSYLPSPLRVVVDIGCGTGRYCTLFAPLARMAIGVDISREQLLQAPAGVHAVCGDAERMAIRTSSVDLALMFLVLQQIPSAGHLNAFSEAARILGPAGVLVIKTSSHADLQSRQFGEFFPSALSVNLARYPDVPELADALRGAGFVAIHVLKAPSGRTIPVDDLVRSIEGRHNTTLALIPESEFVKGVTLMRETLRGHENVRITHYHTLVVARKK